MKYCSQCGCQLSDDVRFCNKCGEAMTEQEKPPGKDFPIKARTIITGVVIVLVLVAGSFLGWRSLGSEARIQQKLDLAVKYLSESRFEEAILQYNEVLKIDNKNLIAYKGLGKTYTIQGNYDKAEKTYQDGLGLVDDKKQLKLSMAGLYIDQGKNDLAEKTYSELIAGDKTFILAYEGLAQLLTTINKQDEAIRLLRQCIETNSRNERGYSLLAEIYLQKGDRSQALDLIAKSLKTNPNQYSAYTLLEKHFKKDWNKIIEYGLTVMAQDETAGRVLRIYGYNNAGQYAKAVEEYLALDDKDKLCDKAKALAALAYLKNNDSRSGDQLIDKIDLRASNPFLYADVARYYLEKGDLKQARDIAMEGISLDDSCQENYIVLIELAMKENGSDIYYSCLLLTRSASPVGLLGKGLELHGVEVKFGNSKEAVTGNQADENITIIPEQDKTLPNSQPNIQVGNNQVVLSTINNEHPISREEGMDLVKNIPDVEEYLAQNPLHKIVNWGEQQNKSGTVFYKYRVAFYRNDPKYPVDPTYGIYAVDSANGQIYRTNGIPAIWSNGSWIDMTSSQYNEVFHN